MSETLTMFEGGATRTAQTGRYDLIPSAATDAIARRLKLGAEKHGENNWRSGGEGFRKASISHAIKHLQEYAERGGQDDLDGAICNLAFLCHFEVAEPYRAPGGVLTATRLPWVAPQIVSVVSVPRAADDLRITEEGAS